MADIRAYAQVWDATTGQPVTPPLWHTRAITSATFSPDSRRIATTSHGDGARVWELKPDRRPVDDWRKLAQILSDTKLDEEGAIRPIEPSELRETYEDVRRSPDTFTACARPGTRLALPAGPGLRGRRRLASGARALGGPDRCRPGVEALRHHRAEAHAELGHWREAAADYRSRGLTPEDWFYDWYSLALLELGRGNREGYRSACSSMLRSFGKGESTAEAAAFTAWVCAIGPQAVEDLGPAIALAERVRTARPDDAIVATALGALLFRAGKFEQAITRLSEASQFEGDRRSSPVYAWSFLAMAHHRLGHAAEAKSWRDKAVTAAEQVLSDHAKGSGEPVPWRRRLTLKLLSEEVKALHPATPAESKAG